MVSPGLYYERGLLHPFIDYDVPPPWLNKPVDPMDDEGFVHIAPEPGLAYDINWDYINGHKVDWPTRAVTVRQNSLLPRTCPPALS